MTEESPFQFLRRKFGKESMNHEGETPVQQKEFDMNDIYQNLVTAFSSSLRWRLDDRFVGALAEFETESKDFVMAKIAEQLPETWDSANIKDAPKVIGTAMKDYGGLQSEQLLFTSDTSEGVILLGLWWPWSNGTKISIRFIPVAPRSSKRLEESQLALKKIFAL